MIVRIETPGWENFTGSLGHQAVFKDGVSVEPLNARQLARIGSSLKIVDVETGQQVGPGMLAALMRKETAPVAEPMETGVQREEREEDERKALVERELAEKAAHEKALAEAAAKIAAEEPVIYTREELEAIGRNDGIQGLRDIATPLGLKGRSINELVAEILKYQLSKVAE